MSAQLIIVILVILSPYIFGFCALLWHVEIKPYLIDRAENKEEEKQLSLKETRKEKLNKLNKKWWQK